MKTDWQLCLKGKSREKRSKICISINRIGDITLNEHAWYMMGKPIDVNLFYDVAGRRIGIKACFWKDPAAHHLYMRPDRRFPRVIRAARLLKQFNIELTETLRFAPPTEEKGDLWTLDLKTAYVPEEVKRHYRNTKKIRP